MKNITIDTNCIIDLEEERQSVKYIRSLIKMHKEDRIKLMVVAISASERKQDRTYASSFGEFTKKLEKIGLGDVEILKPMCYLGICFFGKSLFSCEEMEQSEEKIHSVLFPKIEFKYEDFCLARGLEINRKFPNPKWLNAKCDVQCMWSHIHYQGDIFVTNDKNFHKKTKKAALISLGAGDILIPKEVVFYLENN